MGRRTIPPDELDNARGLAYAVLDKNVRHSTKHAGVIVGDKVLGRIPCLVIAHNNRAPHDILLFFCSSKWWVFAAVGCQSVTDAKRRAEVEYTGSMSRCKM
jgi:hypothetical protein